MSSGSNPFFIFREYILQLNYFPPEIINPDITNFDFILGFASEKGTGKFYPTWNEADLSPQKVKELKEKYPNVRVVISIGGVNSEFNPTEPKEIWIATAVSSIKAIITQYKHKIDGIDIHYDVIKSPVVDFVSYIGEVIKQLKNDPELSITVVSIAPTEKVQLYYQSLYSDNKDIIDLVDYRFYNQKFSSVDEFANFYNRVVNDDYTAPGKVLAGISINPREDPIIFNGIKYLKESNLMTGVFVWNADDSADAPTGPFSLEKRLQKL